VRQLKLDSSGLVVLGEAVADNTAFTDGTSKLLLAGYIYDEVAGTALTENDAAAARINANRAVVGVIEDGTTRGRLAAIKAASTAAVASDTSLVVALSPNTNTVKAVGNAANGAAVSGNPVLICGADVSSNARTVLTDTSGRPSIVGAAAAGQPVAGNPILTAGSDGANVRTLSTDTSGRQVVIGAAADGAAVTGNPVLIAGMDGTNVQTLSTTAAGVLNVALSGNTAVVGAAADGAAVSGNPVLIAGQDGVNAQSILTDTTGRQVVVGAAADGAAATGNPVLIAGVDGSSNAQTLSTQTTGALNIHDGGNSLTVDDGGTTLSIDDGAGSITIDGSVSITGNVTTVGAAADGAAVSGNPVLVAGQDGTNAQSLLTDTAGVLYTRDSRSQQEETWVVQTGNTAHVAAARTTLLDLYNASGSGVILRVMGVYIIPAQAAVVGVGLTYELIRTSAVGTGGSTATPQPYDSNNTALPAQVTARTKPTGGATTSITWHLVNGSSEETSPYAAMASILNHVPQHPRAQPLVLRAGEGIKIDQTTSSNVGNVNIVVVFERATS
jgi:hypothetical protein